tara:strand:+ start:188 stop:421 length:234 start_codon:yes stop_codon:yes gene_type:complete
MDKIKNNMNSREKQHKEMCIRILKSVSFWIETSKFDYKMEDMKSVLDEVKTHYEHYLGYKNDDNGTYKADMQSKSFK